MKKITFLKTLLVALCAMGAMSAWADTETATVLSENYENFTVGAIEATTLQGQGWTLQSKNNKNVYTIVQGAAESANATKFFDFYYPDGGGSRNQSWNFNIASSLNADNWTFTFSAILNPGVNNSANVFYVVGTSSGKVTNANDQVTSPILMLQGTAAAAVTYKPTIDAVAYEDELTLDKNVWYNFTIKATDINEEGKTETLYVKIAKIDGTIVWEKTIENFSFANTGTLRGICWNSPRGASRLNLDNVLVTKEVQAGTCETPTYTITGVNGTARKFTLSCGTEGATIYYSTSELAADASGWTEYTGETTTEAETIYIMAKKGTVYSEVVNFQTGAGETITLNAPSIIKTSYAAGEYDIEINSDQTNLSFVPTKVTIKYSIDEGDIQTYVGKIKINEGSYVSAFVECNGYANSSNAICETEVHYTGLKQEWIQDYTNITQASGTGAYPVVLSGSTETSDGDFTVKGTKYFNIIGYKNGADTVNVNLNTNVGLNVATNYNLRCNGSNSGILQNGANQNIGIKGLHAGDVIVITTNGNNLGALSGVTLKDKMSTTSEYYFLANSSEAEIRFFKGTYNYVKTITVYSPSTVTVQVSEAGYATYISSYALDFSTVSGLTAYTASINGNKVSFIEVTKVPANTGVLLKANAGNYNIPVVADGGDATSALVGGTTAPAGSFVLMNKDGKVGFYKTTNEFTLTANTAYIPGTASVRGFIAIDGEATGISAVNAEQQGAEVYNLNGQRVSKAQKGLYIQNGKKVIMK